MSVQADLEVPIPRYFVREKMRVLKERERMLAHILAKGGHIEQQEPVRDNVPGWPKHSTSNSAHLPFSVCVLSMTLAHLLFSVCVEYDFSTSPVQC